MYRYTKDTVSGAATGLWGGARDVAEQTRQGWENTKGQIELPDWVQKMLHLHEDVGTGGSGGPGGGEPPKQSRVGGAAAVVAASTAAYGYDNASDED